MSLLFDYYYLYKPCKWLAFHFKANETPATWKAFSTAVIAGIWVSAMKTKIISQNSRSWPWQPKMTELLGQTQVGRAPIFHARSTISRLKIWKGKILWWAGWRGRIFLHRPERYIQKSHSKLITTKGGSLRPVAHRLFWWVSQPT